MPPDYSCWPLWSCWTRCVSWQTIYSSTQHDSLEACANQRAKLQNEEKWTSDRPTTTEVWIKSIKNGGGSLKAVVVPLRSFATERSRWNARVTSKMCGKQHLIFRLPASLETREREHSFSGLWWSRKAKRQTYTDLTKFFCSEMCPSLRGHMSTGASFLGHSSSKPECTTTPLKLPYLAVRTLLVWFMRRLNLHHVIKQHLRKGKKR